MRLTVIGCSGSIPGPDSPASSYLIEADGFRLVLDLGNGALGPLQRYVGLYDVDAVCLSHLHTDHCIDMCSYWVARTYAPDGVPPPVPVYGPAGTEQRLARAASVDIDEGMTGAFDFVTLRPGRFGLGPFDVTVEHVNHPVETFGFRIEHAGRVLTYSADTGESAALEALARSADVLLCEASFLDGSDVPADLHLTGRQAGGYATRAGAGQLVLTHMGLFTKPGQALAEAGSSFSGPVSLAATGRVIDLGGDPP